MSTKTTPPELHVRVSGEPNEAIRTIKKLWEQKLGIPASLDTVAVAIIREGIPAFCNRHGLQFPTTK